MFRSFLRIFFIMSCAILFPFIFFNSQYIKVFVPRSKTMMSI